jgi:hypothetical protein
MLATTNGKYCRALEYAKYVVQYRVMNIFLINGRKHPESVEKFVLFAV